MYSPARASVGAMPYGGAAELTYTQCFGNTPHEYCYLDALKVVGKDKNGNDVFHNKSEIFEKKALTTTSPLMAISTSYSDTSGSIPVLLPTVVDAALYDKTRRDTPLASGLIPRVANRGIFADRIRRTALAASYWSGEQDAITATESTYDRQAAKIKFIRSGGQITGPMLVASEVWQNMLTLETEAHYRSVKELEENTIINGNPTTGNTAGGVLDEEAFTGFVAGITTNTTDKNDAEITLGNLRTAAQTIREAKGHPNLIVTDFYTFDQIKGIVQNLLRYPAPTQNIAFGITAMNFEGMPIVPDLFSPTTDNARECYVLDTSSIQMRVLQEATYEELAKTGDSYKFMIKEYLTMVLNFEDWNYRIYDLS